MLLEEYYNYVLKRLPTQLPAKIIAFEILRSIEGRRGLSHAWETIDADNQEEILSEWITIIEKYRFTSHKLDERVLNCGCRISDATLIPNPEGCAKHSF